MVTEQEVWPNFFIVGAQKCGTTSLYSYLKQVPGVYMSAVKEPSHFSPHYIQRDPGRMITDRNEYLRLFKNAKGFIAVGEASPSYLWDPDAPKLIHEAVPHARIIIMLRDPIERAYSNYLMNTMRYSGKRIRPSFYDELKRDYDSRLDPNSISPLYIDLGMYYEQVKRYFDTFGRDQIKVVIFEEFIQLPEQVVNEVLAFLGLSYTVTSINKQHNP
ncbi:MAG: sulfotransferase family protein, partial [Nitrososphaera sp.]